jgi:PAS domain S-box-containing protein
MKHDQSKTILLVDDEMLIAMAEARTLEKHGYVVLIENSGEQSIKTASERPDIDLILMDIDLGQGMDGTQAAAIILETMDIPVLFLSSHTEQNVVEKTEKITSYGYVVKNSGETVLLASIKMAFKLHRTDTHLRNAKEELESTNERLNSTIEELESTNEELKQTVTELEETKQELERSLAERKRTEDIAIRERDFSRAALDSMPGLFYLFNEKGELIRWNKNFTEVSGFSDEEIGSKSPLDFFHEPERSEVEARIREVFLTGESYAEAHLYSKDGSSRPYLFTGKLFNFENRPCLLGMGIDISERKKIENALRENEQLLNDILENVGASIFIKDTSYRYTYANRKVCELFGQDITSIIGKTDRDFFSNDSIEEIMRSDSLVIEEGKTVTREENNLVSADKKPHTYYTVKLPLRDASGTITGLCGISTDITDLKRMESVLEQERTFTNAVLDSVPGLLYLYDEEGHLLRWNKNHETLTGYSADELNGMSILDWFDYDEKEAATIMAGVQRAFREGYASEIGRLKTKNGEKIPYYFTATSLEIEGKKYMTGIGIDMTERKRMEEALEQERTFTNAVLDSVPGLLYLYDEEGHLRRWNKNHETLTGYSADELNGMSILDWFNYDEKEAATIKAGVERAFREGHASEIGRLKAKNGKKIPYYFTATSLEIEGKRYMTGIGIDITERKNAEEALAKALEEKEALLSELQHRMKNNLAMIIGIIDLEKIRLKDRETRGILDTVKGRIESLSNLYSLLYRSDAIMDIGLDVYLSSIVQSLSGIYLTGMNNMEITQRCDPVTVNVKNAAAWGLIVNELLTNALKYAAPKERNGIIRIDLGKIDNEIVLTVSDNGEGPPPDFSIGNPSGLGLLLVQTLSNQLGGSLVFDRGRENVFTVRAPFAPAE